MSEGLGMSSPKKPLKTELHHWWPRTLASHWRDTDGMVSVLRHDGTIRRTKPGGFGAVTNAHHIKMGGPWDTTFEPMFNTPDSEMGDVVEWIFTLDSVQSTPGTTVLKRVLPQSLPESRQHQLGRITASLVARSPRTRNSIKRATEHYRAEFGLADVSADKALIGSNQRGLYDAYRQQLQSSGRWAILFSDNVEFITGNGFYHNFPASVDGFHSGRKCVLPLLPTASIVYMLPSRYPSEPKLVTIKLFDEEVKALNDIVEVYSSDMIFFRQQQRIWNRVHMPGEHRQFRWHRHEWLDCFLDDLSQYNRWGKDGAAGRCSDNPFSSWLKEDIWMERLLNEERD